MGWCVPASAMRWGRLTVADGRPAVYVGPDGRGTAYVADQVWPLDAGFDTRLSVPLPDLLMYPDVTPPRPEAGDLVELRGEQDGETWGFGIVMDSKPGRFTARFLPPAPDEDA